jgi:N,N'-diacetyllegionaminate synthase
MTISVKSFLVGNRIIGPGEPVFIIAEAGVNHNGDLNLAKKLVNVAVEAGADAVKFQTFRAEEVATKIAKLAKYQRKSGEGQMKMVDMLRKLELSEDAHHVIWNHAKKRGILPLSSPYSVGSAELLASLDMAAYKIPSGEITNVELLRFIAKQGKPALLSTGMSTMEEIETAVRILKAGVGSKISILHCVSSYHTPFENANILAIKTLGDRFNFPIGYSDHTMGVEVSVAAAALGACVIEKHITLDRKLPGPDQKVSLMPDEFTRMVRMIRNVSVSLGNGVKKPQPVEKEAMLLARRSLTAARNLRAGSTVGAGDIALKRPGTGISAALLDEFMGRKLTRNVKADEQFKVEDFED